MSSAVAAGRYEASVMLDQQMLVNGVELARKRERERERERERD
jgi:hypothetical protein